MLSIKGLPYGKTALLAAMAAGGICVFGATAAAQSGAVAAQPAVPANAPVKSAAPVRYVPRQPMHAQMIYQGAWGVDSLSVKQAESGEHIRFTFRVVDAGRAAPLNDKKLEPTLIDPQAGVSLVIPSVNNVGALRQTSTPVAGKSYWMIFSNQGRRVKRGDRVDVVIGNFRATGLVVE